MIFMTASSVTGVSGLGDSNGKYKPQNNCSCSCCGSIENNKEHKKIKNSCSIRHNCCDSSSSIKISGENFKIKIC
jgi:hypothetical protein